MHKVTPDQIAEWRIPEAFADQYEITHPENALHGLSTLNVLIGANNSGKSRLLRTLFIDRKPIVSPAREPFSSARHSLDLLRDLMAREYASGISSSFQAVRRTLEYLLPPFFELGVAKPHPATPERQGARQKLDDLIAQIGGNHIADLREPERTDINGVLVDLQEALRDAGNSSWEPRFHRVYIPSLRGLRPFEEKGTQVVDHYGGRTRKDYFPQEALKGQWEMVTGLGLFDEIRKHRLGRRDARRMIDMYEEYLSQRFFDDNRIELIPSEEDNVLLVKIGDEIERPLYHLGDGLQQIIIQTYPIFAHRDKHLLLFVEEPEMHMHAGLQRLLIDTFLDTDDSAGRQVFVTTHSQQFLDLTLDHDRIAVMRATKRLSEDASPDRVSRCSVTLVSNDDLIVLRDLGIHNSSVLLVNTTIWVEGITDRMYFRKFLELFQKQSDVPVLFLEDIHFAFVEYSGSNLAHWSFLDDPPTAMNVERLCGEVLLIADRDKGKEEKHKKIKERIGERYHPLPCKEVENILPPSVIGAVVAHYEKGTTEFPDCDWSDYSDKPLGDFIDERLGGGRKRKTYSDNGSIKDKVSFAEKAIGAMKTFDDLSDSAKELTREIYEFIACRNPKTFK